MNLNSKTASFAMVLVVMLGFVGCGANDQGTSPQAIEERAEEAAENVAIGLEKPAKTARAELVTPDGVSVGEVTFTQEDHQVAVSASVHGVQPPGLHGIHVHEIGDCSAPDLSSAGGHFNPTGAPHACPPNPSRHVGDLGNIEVDSEGNGSLELQVNMPMFSDDPSQSIVGRAVILHAGEDDCVSQPSGDSGPRIACGRIELVAK